VPIAAARARRPIVARGRAVRRNAAAPRRPLETAADPPGLGRAAARELFC